ncbi:MAG: helicase-exonuclease AddAB subunit AddA [Lachnospiraceae bacterium]|nr:helicase-exonuclease AddAB subunit AddA [Lachnospiraceae bacterium]
MGITYSDEQLEVINSRDKNLLVSAAAGAGKTSVLVERIINRTIGKDPVDIDRILVVTFTNAAAAEMKDRLIAGIDEKMAAAEETGDSKLFKALERQATLVHNAQISTIDGFCLNLIRNHFHKIDLDPSFRIANDGEVELLKNDVLDEAMNVAYEEADPEFFTLIDSYSKKDKDTTIEDSIKKIYNSAMSHPSPEKWLEECKNVYRFDSAAAFRKEGFFSDIMSRCIGRLDKCLELFDEAISLIADDEKQKTALKNLQLFREKASGMRSALEMGDLQAAARIYDEKITVKLSFKDCDEAIQNEIKALRSFCTAEMEGIYSSYLLADSANAYEDHMTSGKVVCKIIDLVLDYKKRFDAAKRERGIIDFSDMGHMAIQILIADYRNAGDYDITDVAKEYRDFYEEIMTDEYQDSNEVQEIILSSISRENTDRPGNRFMVGDVKQSIYKFRLAKPEIFMKHYKNYSADGNASKVINLSSNYRSRKEVVDSVNDVFATVMHEETGGVEYDKKEWLNTAASFPEGGDEDYKTEIILLDCGKENADKRREKESVALAEKIMELRGKKIVYDKKKRIYRPADFGDITILFRSIKNWRNPMRKALGAYGIPYHMEGVGTFYEAGEIKTVTNLLSVLDNPLNDITLYGTMTSYFGGMDDEYCARIKSEAETEERTLWDKLNGFAERNPEESKARNFIDMINEYRYLVTYKPISELITGLVSKTGYLNYVTALPDGKQREANIELLIKKATDYANTSFSGLFHFMRYVELLKKNEESEGEANIFDENANTVRIMTIHKSKGLEFPICIVAGIETEFDKRDSYATFVVDSEVGIAAKCIDPIKRTKRTTMFRSLIADKYIKDSAGEEIRILYVAMTRAKEQLILFGIQEDSQNYFKAEDIGLSSSYLSLLRKTIREKGEGNFKISYPNSDDITMAGVKDEADRKAARAFIESGSRTPEVAKLSEEIIKTIGREYAHKDLERLYTKTTVSALKMEAMEETQGETKQLFEQREVSEVVPEFAGGGKKVSGTDRGTAYHKLLQLIDFTKDLTEEELRGQFKHMLEADFMEEYEQELIDEEKIFAFARTDLAKRMQKAAKRGELFKEQPFVMGVPANRVDPEFPESETVLVQGVIDVYFVEDDRVVVMDYKTDRVKDAPELKDRYRAQIAIYAEALEKLTAKPVKEMLLYSFGLNETVVVE